MFGTLYRRLLIVILAFGLAMVAIFAVRITDGTGKPAAARSATRTSPGQPRFSALVIMTTQRRPCASSMPPEETTSAGRDRRVARSA